MRNIYSKILFTSLWTIFFSGCTSDKEMVQSYLKEVDISLNDEFKVIKCETEGTTDFIFQCEIIVTSSDSERLVNQIKSRKYFNYDFPKIQQLEQYKDIEKQAWFKDDFYYVEFFNYPASIRKSMFFYPSEKRLKYTYYDE